MQLTELQPDTVYRITSHDSHSASNRYQYRSYFAATGNPVRVEKRNFKNSPNRVELHPLADTPANTAPYGTVVEPEWRRGLSIICRICTVEEWPAFRADAVATIASRMEAQRIEDEAKHARQERLLAVCRTLGFGVTSYGFNRWADALIESSDCNPVIEALEAQAATRLTPSGSGTNH